MDEQSGTLSQNASRPVENTEPEFLGILRAASKYKVRSSEAHDTVHGPQLGTKPHHVIDLLLLGDSMFERFLTTGKSTVLGSDHAKFPSIMNAGVGGDRIVNIVYRLVEKGLLFALRDRCTVNNIMIEMGTNDIANDKRPVSDLDVQLYGRVIEALRWACPDVKICVCALNPRTRVKTVGVENVSNEKLENMVSELRTKGWNNVTFMHSDPALINHLEDDGLHLNKRGYEMFAAALWEQYQRMKDGKGSQQTLTSSKWSELDHELQKNGEFEGWKID